MSLPKKSVTMTNNYKIASKISTCRTLKIVFKKRKPLTFGKFLAVYRTLLNRSNGFLNLFKRYKQALLYKFIIKGL